MNPQPTNPTTPNPNPQSPQKQLISFDIGIKHLAYCILQYQPAITTEYEILEWKVINLLQSDEEKGGEFNPQPLCQNPLKTISKKNPPKICSKKAQFQTPPSTPEKAIEYYCNKHATSHPLYLHPQDSTYPLYSTTQLSKMDKPALQSYLQSLIIQQQPQQQPQQQSTIPQTKKELLPYIKSIQQQIYLQPLVAPAANQPKANHANMVVLCHALYRQLSLLESRFPDITQVVIENQIGNIAARMMVLQGMITMFYASRTIPVQIEHVSSSHKLKYAASLVPSLFPPEQNNSIAPSPSETTKQKTAYQEHKLHAKEYCSAILETKAATNPRFQFFYCEFQENKKKKDDLADCFLQAIWSIGTQYVR